MASRRTRAVGAPRAPHLPTPARPRCPWRSPTWCAMSLCSETPPSELEPKSRPTGSTSRMSLLARQSSCLMDTPTRAPRPALPERIATDFLRRVRRAGAASTKPPPLSKGHSAGDAIRPRRPACSGWARPAPMAPAPVTPAPVRRPPPLWRYIAAARRRLRRPSPTIIACGCRRRLRMLETTPACSLEPSSVVGKPPLRPSSSAGRWLLPTGQLLGGDGRRPPPTRT